MCYSRVHDLVSDKLIAVFIYEDSLTLPQDKADEVGLNTDTVENIPSFIKDETELNTIVERLMRGGVRNLSVLPMADYITLQADGELFMGAGQLLWAEMGQAMPDNFRIEIYNDREDF